MKSEFTHVMLKVCVKLAALSAERPGRRKTIRYLTIKDIKNLFHNQINNRKQVSAYNFILEKHIILLSNGAFMNTNYKL